MWKMLMLRDILKVQKDSLKVFCYLSLIFMLLPLSYSRIFSEIAGYKYKTQPSLTNKEWYWLSNDCYRWVEQDPKEILSSVYHCMEQTLHSCKDLKINPADIKGDQHKYSHYISLVMQQTQTILTSDLILISVAEGWYDPLNPKSDSHLISLHNITPK